MNYILNYIDHYWYFLNILDQYFI